jgi:hypothetical protein
MDFFLNLISMFIQFDRVISRLQNSVRQVRPGNRMGTAPRNDVVILYKLVQAEIESGHSRPSL